MSARLFARRMVPCATLIAQRRLPSVSRSLSYKVNSASKEITGRTGNVHRSNAEELIAKAPVVEVDGPVALCDGGGGSLGHPIEYIQLDTANPHTPKDCKYCGLRYVMKPHH